MQATNLFKEAKFDEAKSEYLAALAILETNISKGYCATGIYLI